LRPAGEHGSLGLGLYIAREIARAHGGEIQARSDNTETVFAVYLPRHPSSAVIESEGVTGS
jgi:signal transduction histidine kinase